VIRIDTAQFKQALSAKAKQMHAAARPAAQAGAQIIYAAAKANVPVSKGAHWFNGTHSKYQFNAGTLRDSIYQVYSKDKSREGLATYHVAWNHKKCPYGFMVEFGTSRAPAHPFLGPAISEGRAAAVQAMQARFLAEMSK